MRDFLAARAAKAEASATMMAAQKAEEMRRKGVDVISLTVGEPDFNTPDHVKAAAKRALDDNFTKYTASAGIPELREVIAEKSYRENKIATDAAHTLVTPTKHALFASLFATVDPGDEVLLPDPCFVSYAPQVKLCGGVPVWVPLRKENAYSINAADVEAKVTKKTKMLMLCSPSNPTGMTDDEAELKSVVEVAQERDFLLLSDEIYEHILYEGRHVSPASLPGGADRTITINGLSKSFAMTGWRMGWLHAPSPVFEAIARLQTQTITQVTSFVQKASLDALRGPQDSVEKMRKEFQARRDLIVKEIEKTPGLSILKPKGAFYAWPEIDLGITGDQFADFLLDQAHVAVVPGSGFGPSGKNHVRLSYGTSRDRLVEAFRRIRKAVSTVEPKTVALGDR